MQHAANGLSLFHLHDESSRRGILRPGSLTSFSPALPSVRTRSPGALDSRLHPIDLSASCLQATTGTFPEPQQRLATR